ncbi:hypothetical protein FM076_19505 [Streptomyces albus subsp. chlorinus]|uniref:hypothetical protein n=1 Tax=Streptomyces albus TaxID=1888 RepID=UPI00156DE00E|nr:hypothetical protein [Streptomyces albus subsp. chlorinus]
MPRRARKYAVRTTYATNAALALVLAGALTACTGSSGSDGGEDGKAGDSSASPTAAEPGKYRTLPKPCDVVSVGTLREMLPGAAAEDDGTAAPSAGASPYEGEPTATYDTDRRVGCRWKNATSLSTRHLNIDFERVVSYDPAVSDDEQAERLYAKKARKAGIPLDPDDTSPDADSEPDPGSEPDSGSKSSGSPKTDSSKKDGEKGSGHKGGTSPDGHTSPSGAPDASSSPEDDVTDSPSATPGEDLAPRSLDDLGDAAYIDDELHTADSGLHRDITLVFRTANVIATVEYEQWVTDKHRIPDSQELQERARELAAQLAEQFED